MERPITLLLVDDESTLRGLVAQFLRRTGFHVTEAEDGIDGLARFEGSGPFDLVMSDVLMPRLDGIEFCRRVKWQRPEQSILICTAALDLEQEDLLRAAGIVQFLRKPYHPTTLLARIDDGLVPTAASRVATALT